MSRAILNHVSLFTGYGGFELAFRLAGIPTRTILYCDIEPYSQEIIKARIKDGYLDDAPIWPDIRTLRGEQFRGLVDIVTGGFPCQDISTAGRRAGITGSRSGLWFEMLRFISEVRPRYVFVENVSAILSRGVETVLGGLAEVGYDAEWAIVSAADCGAPHLRKRWWCLAYPGGERYSAWWWPAKQARQHETMGRRKLAGSDGKAGQVADANSERIHSEPQRLTQCDGEVNFNRHGEVWTMAHAYGNRLPDGLWGDRGGIAAVRTTQGETIERPLRVLVGN